MECRWPILALFGSGALGGCAGSLFSAALAAPWRFTIASMQYGEGRGLAMLGMIVGTVVGAPLMLTIVGFGSRWIPRTWYGLAVCGFLGGAMAAGTVCYLGLR